MSGETNLDKLIAEMEPVLNEGEYVFATVANTDKIAREMVVCEIKEKEGITVVLPKEEADRLALNYDFVAAWITLNVHSSLDAIGLTAAFSTALKDKGISCNVIAGYYHDHIFVNTEDKDEALRALKELANR